MLYSPTQEGSFNSTFGLVTASYLDFCYRHPTPDVANLNIAIHRYAQLRVTFCDGNGTPRDPVPVHMNTVVGFPRGAGETPPAKVADEWFCFGTTSLDHFRGWDRKGGYHPLRVVMERKTITVEESTTAILANAWPGRDLWLLGINSNHALLTSDENGRV